MSISVACQCGKRFRAKPELAGKRAKCPSCQSPISIPAPPASSDSPSTIQISCQCGQRFKAPAHLAGKRVNCTVCKRPIDVLDPRRPEAFPAPLDSPLQQPHDDPLHSSPQDPLGAPGGFDWDDLPLASATPNQPVPDATATMNTGLANDLVAKAQAEAAEKKSEKGSWANTQIMSGIGMMIGAVTWFGVGLVFGRIFCYPPVLFVLGVIAAINGVAYKIYLRST